MQDPALDETIIIIIHYQSEKHLPTLCNLTRVSLQLISLCKVSKVNNVLGNTVLPCSYGGKPKVVAKAFAILGASDNFLIKNSWGGIVCEALRFALNNMSSGSAT